MRKKANETLELRAIQKEDCYMISEAFQEQGWNKPVEQYKRYFEYQVAGTRDIIIAESAGEFAGYLTIQWQSSYLPFREKDIPEVVDFNVLKKFQRKGIGTVLMNEAERRIQQKSNYAGIGFGMYKDYGAAQILYIKRGYIPDGNGLVKDYKSIPYGQTITVDDSIVLYLVKKLAHKNTF